jgi:hypothetical protein
LEKTLQTTVIADQQFGCLTTIASAYHDSRLWWLCRCKCGASKEVRDQHLRSGAVRSCGCMKNRPKHSMIGTPEYNAWVAMKNRCRHPRCKGYPNYGGRGIRFCDRWANDFVAFFADMGPRPSSLHSLERIDSNGHYEPGNCRWATRGEQNRNRRNNVIITAWGRQQVVTDWAREVGIDPKVITKRIEAGWPAEDALTRSTDDRWASRRFRQQITNSTR